MAAQSLVEGTGHRFKIYIRDCEGVKRTANTFVGLGEKLQDMDRCELLMQTTLPGKRIRKKKKMPGEV